MVNKSIIFGSVGKYVPVRAYRYTANLCWLGRGDQAMKGVRVKLWENKGQKQLAVVHFVTDSLKLTQ